MRLCDWLEKDGRSIRQLAQDIGVRPMSAGRYVKETRIPTPEIMREIVRVTEGAVTANDFYRIEVPAEVWG